MNLFINGFGQELQVAAGDRCHHKLYGYGDVLDVYKDDNNRLIVQVRFRSGFQYFNYGYFMDVVTLFPKGKEFPTCPLCGKNPVLSAEELCPECAAAKKEKKTDAKPVKAVAQGYFDDEEFGDDEVVEVDRLDMGYLEDMGEDEGGTGKGRAEDEDFSKHGFSYGDFNR